MSQRSNVRPILSAIIAAQLIVSPMFQGTASAANAAKNVTVEKQADVFESTMEVVFKSYLAGSVSTEQMLSMIVDIGEDDVLGLNSTARLIKPTEVRQMINGEDVSAPEYIHNRNELRLLIESRKSEGKYTSADEAKVSELEVALNEYITTERATQDQEDKMITIGVAGAMAIGGGLLGATGKIHPAANIAQGARTVGEALVNWSKNFGSKVAQGYNYALSKANLALHSILESRAVIASKAATRSAFQATKNGLAKVETLNGIGKDTMTVVNAGKSAAQKLKANISAFRQTRASTKWVRKASGLPFIHTGKVFNITQGAALSAEELALATFTQTANKEVSFVVVRDGAGKFSSIIFKSEVNGEVAYMSSNSNLLAHAVKYRTALHNLAQGIKNGTVRIANRTVEIVTATGRRIRMSVPYVTLARVGGWMKTKTVAGTKATLAFLSNQRTIEALTGASLGAGIGFVAVKAGDFIVLDNPIENADYSAELYELDNAGK